MAIFCCENCGKEYPDTEGVRVPFMFRLAAALPLGWLPAKVCRKCETQVVLTATISMVVLVFVVVVILAKLKS